MLVHLTAVSAHLGFIQPDDACAFGFLPQPVIINKAPEGLTTIGIRPISLINPAAGHMAFKALRAEGSHP